MAPGDNIDQDALAEQWGASLDSEDPAAAAAEAAANELSETMAEQWAAMVDDGSRNISSKASGERITPLPASNTKASMSASVSWYGSTFFQVPSSGNVRQG